MKREQILFVLGILIVLSPFYGLPERALTPITILLGFAVIFFSLSRGKADQNLSNGNNPTAE